MSTPSNRTLFLPILPKKLNSRSNLHTYFSKFGDVKDVSVNKDNKTGIVEFSSHAEAKTAKIQGKLYEGQILKIVWNENIIKASGKILDPRAKELENVIEIDNLWEDDDKECFGVETKPVVDESKKTAKDIISHHLKLPIVKRRLGSAVKTRVVKKSEGTENKISPVKLSKTQPKKILANKRKLSNKVPVTSVKKSNPSVNREQSSPLSEQMDLKQKLALLDERDKLIRQKTVQDSNIKTAVAIKGTCPDMCPERERILRQCGHQIAVYESLPGTNEMDENRAVKEYIRSSADQEVPLPHDLRPGPVLSMTMNYLITNIISQIDDPNENKAVWYSFCWNRLRSIRKDIILQQLCDLETVTIVEQCARFHICCYDHMWGIEVSGYSDKINTNNLIDCLQTLKHLYEDLAKRNIKCPNEPEFHSYLILLKLSTGDVFWEYQQYAPYIQLSPKVQFAISVYVAFINNMYSKYFSLVKQASYLEACLMQRHFDEVRKKALKVMLKAYSLPNRSVSLNTYFLKNCLKFDSQKNVLRFWEKVEGSLDKKIEFDEDETEDECISTSSFLIKDKRLPIANAVVGENKPLPIYVPHQVHTSFDEGGKLRDSLQSVPDENFLTHESPLDESDSSIQEATGLPQPLTKNQPFKFSLSPKLSEENVFKTVFSKLAPLKTENIESMNTKLLDNGSAKLKSSLLQLNSKDAFEDDDSFYEGNQTKSFKMEEDLYEEIMDTEKVNEISTEKPPLFTQFHPDQRSVFSFQQIFPPMVYPPVPANNNFTLFQGVENQTLKMFPTITNFLDKSPGTFHFLPSTPKLETADQFPSKRVTSDNSPSGRTVPLQNLPPKIENQNKVAGQLLFSQNEINLTLSSENHKLKVDEEHLSKIKEIEMKALKKEEEILEQAILRKAEEERMLIEAAQKAEAERLKKKQIEKQKELEKLKKDLRQRMKVKNAKKYGRIWKSKVEKLKEKRADFPILHQLSVESHLKLWGRMKFIPNTSVFQRAKDRQTLNRIVNHLLKNGVTDECRYVGRDLAELLAKSAAKSMDMGSIRSVYWKMAMSLPWKDKSTSHSSVFNQMMRRCCRQTFYKEADAQLGSVELSMTSLKIPVHVSVHLLDDLQYSSGLHCLDALMFVVVDAFESEKSCLDRLRSLVTSQAKRSELSVSVLTINGGKYDRALKMELTELQEQSFIANWTVSAWTSPDCFMANLAFLTEQVHVVQDVCARRLASLIKETIDDFIYDVARSQVFCPTLIEALENPNTTINIYNTFLTKLEDLLLSSKLEKYFNLAEEFKSHIPTNEFGGPELMCGKQYNNQYKAQISNTISSLKLPEFQGWPVNSNEIDFNSLADLVESYCRTEMIDMEVFQQIIWKLARETEPSSDLNSYSWLHIVELLAESRLNQVFSMEETSRKMLVIYSKRDLKKMISKQWWITLPIVAQISKLRV